MPNLFSSFKECFGFSHIIKSQFLRFVIARSDMSPKLPIGVATIFTPKFISLILILNLFIFSCTPINSPIQSEQSSSDNLLKKENKISQNQKKQSEQKIESSQINSKIFQDTELQKKITILFSNNSKEKFSKKYINILELGVYNKNLKNVSFEINFFENEKEFSDIVNKDLKKGKIFIGPADNNYTKIAKTFCDKQVIFFAFSSDTSLADNCIYLINFFPKNELEELFAFLKKDSKVALLYPENDYGYMINSLIDDVVNTSDAILINRSSYKVDLSNVRDAIKELGKYELRKYELDRQKQILSKKQDEISKKRLKKLQRFKTTSDYDFTHILIADYGLNLLQVAPLLPYYDIDPQVVQFLSTGVIDDENFFLEPSLQGTIFPGIEKAKRLDLLLQYKEIYNENLLRVSTLTI